MSLTQGVDGAGCRQGSPGQCIPACCQTGRQEAKGVRCGEKSQRCNHVSGILNMSMLMCVPDFEILYQEESHRITMLEKFDLGGFKPVIR